MKVDDKSIKNYRRLQLWSLHLLRWLVPIDKDLHEILNFISGKNAKTVVRRKDAKQSEEERRALEEKEARERDIRVKFSLMGKGTLTFRASLL